MQTSLPRLLLGLLLAAALCLASGCTRYSYEIEMQPIGGNLERRLKFESQKGQSPAELARLAQIYHASSPGKASDAHFKGTFYGKLPQDVGGAGEYVRFESPLGTAIAYVERFRGNDDLYSQLEVRRKAVDQLADLIVSWFESELTGAPGWPALKEFLDKPFRNDLQNFSLLAWGLTSFGLESEDRRLRVVLEVEPRKEPAKPQGNARKQSNRESSHRRGPPRKVPANLDVPRRAEAEILLRALQYAIERGYFSAAEIPRLNRILRDFQRDDTALWALIRGWLISRSGNTPQALPPEKLAFVADWRHVQTSWRNHFEKSDYFRSRRAEFLKRIDDKQKKETFENRDSDAQSPSAAQARAAQFAERRVNVADEVALDLVYTALLPIFGKMFHDGDKLEIRLSVPRPPLWTNGTWLSERKQLAWSEQLAPTDEAPLLPDWPVLCFATWVEPKQEPQQRLFGQAAVDDNALLDYCLWYQSLSADEKQQWDTMVAGLGPDKDWRSALNHFRFAGEPQTLAREQSAAAGGFDVLWPAFKASSR